MNLSQTEEYALRAVLFIAGDDPTPIRASRLAAELSLPRNYLGKTLTALVASGILASSRGTRGGFRLARPAQTITLTEITAAFSGSDVRRCLLGLGRCGEHPECPVHQRWAPAASLVSRFFDATTVADLLPTSPRPHAALLRFAEHELSTPR
jgi:Rrf2 family protein